MQPVCFAPQFRAQPFVGLPKPLPDSSWLFPAISTQPTAKMVEPARPDRPDVPVPVSHTEDLAAHWGRELGTCPAPNAYTLPPKVPIHAKTFPSTPLKLVKAIEESRKATVQQIGLAIKHTKPFRTFRQLRKFTNLPNP